MSVTEKTLDKLNNLLDVVYPQIGYSSYTYLKGMGKRRSNVYTISTPSGGVTYSPLNGRFPKQTIRKIEDRIKFVEEILSSEGKYKLVIFAKHKKDFNDTSETKIFRTSHPSLSQIKNLQKHFGLNLAQTLSPHAMNHGVEIFKEDILDYPSADRWLKNEFKEGHDDYRLYAQIVEIEQKRYDDEKDQVNSENLVQAMNLWQSYLDMLPTPANLSQAIIDFAEEYTVTGLQYAIADIVEDAVITLEKIDDSISDAICANGFFYEQFLNKIKFDKKT